MAYYFKCAECGKKETFGTTKLFEEINEGKKQEYETVVCTTCINKKVRLKGNYTIAICIVLLRTMILDLNEFFGYRDIIIFMVVQFVLTFNIYLTIKLNWKGR